MTKKSFVELLFRQIDFIRELGWLAYFKKVLGLRISMKAVTMLRILLTAPIALPSVMIIRIIRPWFLVRIGVLNSNRIGHCASEPEIYLCKQDADINVPEIPYVDLWYLSGVEHFIYNRICNEQLIRMWKRKLRIWSGFLPGLFLNAVDRINRLIPGSEIHKADPTQSDLDTHNLYDQFPPHLNFLPEEEKRGQAEMGEMGIPQGVPFVCLYVRDSAYLDTVYGKGGWMYHNYRNSDIQDYVQTAEELAKRGYYVIRMGAIVKDGIKTKNSKVIDYAFNGMRSAFMDIYLGARCEFGISTGAGFDAVMEIFRRKVVYVNITPQRSIVTARSNVLSIVGMNWLIAEKRNMSFQEVFESGAGSFYSVSEYEANGIKLIRNSPEDIKAVVVEMVERFNGAWQPEPEDEFLQQRFWDIFPEDARSFSGKLRLHGEIRSRIGASFLRKHRDLITSN